MPGVPLPADNTPWPPPSEKPYQDDYTEADAWYSGDPKRLADFYSKATTAADRRNRVRLWARSTPDRDQYGRISARVHVPAAADIAATSADLLFAEPPTIQIGEAHQDTAVAGAKDVEDRLRQIVDETDLASTLLEAAEIASGIGGVYLRPLWDPSLVEMPVLTAVHADKAIPEFQWGQLRAVTFWRTVLEHGNVVWRHLERHEPGVILHGLYAGTRQSLGLRRPLDSLAETAGLAVDDNDTVQLPAGITGLAVRYVPNSLPNRRHRGARVGQADTAGAESLMDALDDTMTSWIRDIRLGQGRIIVPSEFLERTGRGGGATFDPDREVFAPLDMDPANQEKAGITVAQFSIRAVEHAATAEDLFQRIVVSARYSPQTFGLHGTGSEQTATEVRAREARSYRTNGKKERYFRSALTDVLEMMLVIDREVFGQRHDVFRPVIEFADAGDTDVREVASSLNLINLAQAASIETKVRMLHPDWDDATVKVEAEAIRLEQGIGPVEDPTGGAP